MRTFDHSTGSREIRSTPNLPRTYHRDPQPASRHLSVRLPGLPTRWVLRLAQQAFIGQTSASFVRVLGEPEVARRVQLAAAMTERRAAVRTAHLQVDIAVRHSRQSFLMMARVLSVVLSARVGPVDAHHFLLGSAATAA